MQTRAGYHPEPSISSIQSKSDDRENQNFCIHSRQTDGQRVIQYLPNFIETGDKNVDMMILVSVQPYLQVYSLGKSIRSKVCLDILSYIHDIAIPTKDLGSGLQELQL